MSIQYGECSFEGKSRDRGELAEVEALIAPYGPDGGSLIWRDGFGMLFRAFHTTAESRRQKQPHTSRSGTILMWDGRLDNRRDMIGVLGEEIRYCSTDLEIVTAAYERWGIGAFRKLIGDWALSIWDPLSKVLTLAKDFLGTRTLFYSLRKDHVAWCTILDPLVRLAPSPLKLEEEYLAGWLSLWPAAHLTPYSEIRSVPPSSFIRFANGQGQTVNYWAFDPTKTIRYRDDREYEQHFRSVFSQSVRRRLRSDKPVLAELSGGIDSTSIVCIADDLLSQTGVETPRLDTVSYFDDSEPNWNERPYFEMVENKRGTAGCHIEIASENASWFIDSNGPFSATPNHFTGSAASVRKFRENVTRNGNRVLLCGIGGDEVLGGVPSPIPELADLLVRGNLVQFARQLEAWAVAKRKPVIFLLWATLRLFLPSPFSRIGKNRPSLSWLEPRFATRQQRPLNGYCSRLRILGALPSHQENIHTLDLLRRQLSLNCLSADPILETCYPYLDRDLLEFLYAIPREQVIRPGERRSLMRRSLRGRVPDDVLDRKRKAFAARRDRAALRDQWAEVIQLGQDMHLSQLGIVRPTPFVEALNRIRMGQEAQFTPLARALSIESWLRNACRYVSLGHLECAREHTCCSSPEPFDHCKSGTTSALMEHKSRKEVNNHEIREAGSSVFGEGH